MPTQKLLIHVLAVFPEKEGKCKVRATIRSGDPRRGDKVWFETRELHRKNLVVCDVRPSPRLSTITLEGNPDDVAALEGGMYLRNDDPIGSD